MFIFFTPKNIYFILHGLNSVVVFEVLDVVVAVVVSIVVRFDSVVTEGSPVTFPPLPA